MLPAEDYIRLGWYVIPRDLSGYPDPFRAGPWLNVPHDILAGHDVRLGWFKTQPELFGGAGRPRITSGGSAAGTVGSPFSYQITASNNPTSFAANVPPPAGLTVNSSGLISGTPTDAGTTSVTVSASNDQGKGSRTVSIVIAAAGLPPVITGPATLSGTVNVALSQQMVATGNPTSWLATGLPAGLTINNSGLISGTPTATGTSTATIKASSTHGDSAEHSLSVNISAVAVVPKAFYGPLPNGTTVTELLDADFIRGLAHTASNPAKGQVLTTPVPTGSQGVCFAYPATLGMAASATQTPPGFDVLAGLNKTTLMIPPDAADSTPIEYQIIYQRVTAAYSSAVTYALTI